MDPIRLTAVYALLNLTGQHPVDVEEFLSQVIQEAAAVSWEHRGDPSTLGNLLLEVASRVLLRP